MNDGVFAFGLAPRKTLTIANNGSLSTPCECLTHRPQALLFDGWTPASVTVQVSLDGVTWFDLYTRFVEFSIDTVAAGRWVLLDPLDVLTWAFFRLRSGSAAVPVPQLAERSIVVVMVP